MLIETVKITEERGQKEVKLPYYTTDGKKYTAILSEKKIIEADKYGVQTYEFEYLVKKAAADKECTESEFLAAYLLGRMNTEYKITQNLTLTNE